MKPAIASMLDDLTPTIIARIVAAKTGKAVADPGAPPQSGAQLVDVAQLRAHIETVLAHLMNYLTTQDVTLHREFLRAYLAMRADTRTLTAAISSLTETLDVAAKVVADAGPDSLARRRVVLAIIKASAEAAKYCNDLIAEEVATRVAQLAAVRIDA